MNYRQWKKNYKKRNGANPPLEVDKRKQAKIMKCAMRSIKKNDIQQVVNNVVNAYMQAIGSLSMQLGKALELAGKRISEIRCGEESNSTLIEG